MRCRSETGSVSMETALLLLLVLLPLTFSVMVIPGVLRQAVAGEWASKVSAEAYVLSVTDGIGQGLSMLDSVTAAKQTAETLAAEEMEARGVDTSDRCAGSTDTECFSVTVCADGSTVRVALRYRVQLGRFGFDLRRAHHERLGEYTGVGQLAADHSLELGACP